MKYPNVRYATFVRGLTQYRLASSVGMSESRLCRCSRGVQEFTPEERARIAQALRFDEKWLFEQPKPRLSKPFDNSPVVTVTDDLPAKLEGFVILGGAER
ncbi:MAG: helix-turn-helix transcriptional regulator [Candidatus Acidiferrum sp.]